MTKKATRIRFEKANNPQNLNGRWRATNSSPNGDYGSCEDAARCCIDYWTTQDSIRARLYLGTDHRLADTGRHTEAFEDNIRILDYLLGD